TVAPPVDEILVEPPAQIMIGFNHELDQTRVDPESVRIERTGPASPVEIVAGRAAVPVANPRALLLWPAAPLREGHYRVVMRMAAPLTDIAGEALRSKDSAEVLITTFDVEAAP